MESPCKGVQQQQGHMPTTACTHRHILLTATHVVQLGPNWLKKLQDRTADWSAQGGRVGIVQVQWKYAYMYFLPFRMW
jgi:hypothetical protein